MHCPFCRTDETKVIDSRGTQDGAIRRRRECLSCQRRFTTYEKIEESPLRVLKKDGSRVPFSRQKIAAGLEHACVKRPVTQDQIDSLIATVESDLFETFDREIESRQIAEAVMEELRDLDEVAYIRFASVYREFDDPADFNAEISGLPAGRLHSFAVGNPR